MALYSEFGVANEKYKSRLRSVRLIFKKFVDQEFTFDELVQMVRRTFDLSPKTVKVNYVLPLIEDEFFVEKSLGIFVVNAKQVKK